MYHVMNDTLEQLIMKYINSYKTFIMSSDLVREECKVYMHSKYVYNCSFGIQSHPTFYIPTVPSYMICHLYNYNSATYVFAVKPDMVFDERCNKVIGVIISIMHTDLNIAKAILFNCVFEKLCLELRMKKLVAVALINQHRYIIDDAFVFIIVQQLASVIQWPQLLLRLL